VGKLKNETVAVKKVKDEKDSQIHHLRKLNHPNIIQVLNSSLPADQISA